MVKYNPKLFKCNLANFSYKNQDLFANSISKKLAMTDKVIPIKADTRTSASYFLDIRAIYEKMASMQSIQLSSTTVELKRLTVSVLFINLFSIATLY